MAFELILKGRVQGVGCRYYCAQVARHLKISGSATNRHDGAVSVLLDTVDQVVVDRYIEALEHNTFRLNFFGSIREVTKTAYYGPLRGDYEW